MILIILLIALLLRLVFLNQSLWLDEAVQAITAGKSFSYIFQEITGDFHPPLYHFLMHFWVRVFGSSEIALRMPSVIFGVATVYLVYKLAELGGGGKSGKLISALLLATAPFHIYYSQEARMYCLVTFLTAGSMYFFLRILEEKKGKEDWKSKGMYFLFTLLALYADYYAFLILLAQAGILILKKKYKFFLFYSFFLIAYLPWVPMFLTQLKVGKLATHALPEWGRLVNLSLGKSLPLTLVKFSLGRITIFNKSLYALATTALFLAYSSIAIKGFWKRKKDSASFQALMLFWLVVPIALAWLVSFFVPNYQPFRLLLVLPAFYLLLTQGILAIKSKKPKLVVLGVVLAVNLLSLSAYYSNPYFQREDWRGMVQFLQKQTDSVVILPSGTSNWPIRYYDPEGKVKLVSPGQGAKEIGRITGIEGGKIYYIRYLVSLFDPGERILEELRQKGYTKVKEESFNQIPLWQFQKQ